ncbi:MAG: hypothetical protein ABI416_08755, partial [Ginsengibacter sp.]
LNFFFFLQGDCSYKLPDIWLFCRHSVKIQLRELSMFTEAQFHNTARNFTRVSFVYSFIA